MSDVEREIQMEAWRLCFRKHLHDDANEYESTCWQCTGGAIALRAQRAAGLRDVAKQMAYSDEQERIEEWAAAIERGEESE